MWTRRALAFVAAPCAVVAQATHTVGPGAHPTIDAAIAVAAPADVVVVLGGTYANFAVDKALTIRAATPGTVALFGISPPTRVMPPAGADVHLVGLRLDHVEITSGNVTMEQCENLLWWHEPYRTRVVGATLHIQSCALDGGTATASGGDVATIDATNAEITIVDSDVRGHSASYVTPAGHAIRLTNSRLRASHCQLYGGISSWLMPNHGRAVAGDLTSRMWISDSTIRGSGGACPVFPMGWVDRCTITPSCSHLWSGSLLGVHRPAPLANGAPFALEFRTEPFAPVGVWAAHELVSLAIPGLEQTLLLAPANAFPAGVAVADAAGLAAPSWSIPAGPQFVDRALWLQGFAGASSPLQASPVVGGVVR